MTKSHISDADIEAALDYLTQNAQAAAKARAERLYLEDYTRVIKAQIMQKWAMHPLGAQEREAYASKEYGAHLHAVRLAVEEDEKHRFLMDAAKTKCDAWRTMCATERAMKI